METTTIRGRCHCKSFTLSVSIPSTSFPIDSSFCSCSSCQHATGQLAASFAVIPVDSATLGIDVSHLSHYATSGHRTRYFCPNCGANVMDFDEEDGMWRICTGVMDKTEGLLNRNQIFIEDTRDGGQSVWLEGVGPRFLVGPKSETLQADLGNLPSMPSDSDRRSKSDLNSCCQCNGVNFNIKAPSDDKRYTAGIDTCSSCRLTTGFELTAWTSVPLESVHMTEGAPLNLDMANLKKYVSSPGVSRYFCQSCGAAIFVAKDDQSWIDIAAGILRAEEGARAERWLQWKEVGFPEEATDQTVIKVLMRGMEV